MALTKAQAEAVATVDGPLLIIAGPGSGKTSTLVERIAHLVMNLGVDPSAIMVSTFTEKAAMELIARVSRRLTDAGVQLNLAEMGIGTLHSLCLRWLDEHRDRTRLKRSYQVLDQFEQAYLLFRSYEQFRATPELALVVPGKLPAWTLAERLAARFNQCSEELLDPRALMADVDPATAALGVLYQRYLDLLADPKHNALDFSLIQVEAWRLISSAPDILEALQRRYRYIMIDEYQDTNTVQEAIVAKLAAGHGNLCVVGDDDQALYRFRGATVRNILEFEHLLPGRACAVVRLEDNFRSHQHIVDFYSEWMTKLEWSDGQRSFRHSKQLRAAANRPWIGPAVQRVSASSVEGWCAEVTEALFALRDEGSLGDWNQVAFLFRSLKHDDVLTLAAYLERQGVGVYAPRSRMFFDRPEVLLTVGALLYLFPQSWSVLTTRWPDDGQRPDVWAWFDASLQAFVDIAREPAHRDLLVWAKHLRQTHGALAEPTDYAFAGLFYQLLQFEPWAQHLGDSARGGVKDSRPARNLAILSQLLTRFEHLHGIDVLKPDYLELNLKHLLCNYLRFLFDGGIEEFEDEAEIAPSGCVSFFTIHQSKGLEFPVVVVGSLYASPRSTSDPLGEHLAEVHFSKPPYEPIDAIANFDFWRLYYVAFSRAQNLLLLTDPARSGHGANPSKTFRPVVAHLPSWRSHRPALQQLELMPVVKSHLQRAYSFTGHVSVFETCARQYQVFKDLDFAPVRSQAILFGTLVHQTIEDVHRSAMAEGDAALTHGAVEAWFDENYRFLSARERKYLAPSTRAAALRQVLRYVSAQRARGGDQVWARLVDAEVDVSLLRPGYLLKGSVDLLRDEGGGLEVLDFKTETKPDLRDPTQVDRYRRQLEVYAHLVEGQTGKPVTKMTLYYTGEPDGSNPMISWPVDRRRVDQTLDTIDGVVERIEKKDFHQPDRPRGRVCDGCDLKAHCDRRC
ncbi:MAG: ATP-dependent helicase [Deltaproteobacteria bacterium]|nr:ATP-dependent helicase [Deltaproteobacteria bacterium]